MLFEGKSDAARLQPCCLGASSGGTAVEPQGCRCCRSPAGKSHLTSWRGWGPLARARPRVLTTPIVRQRRTLIRLSCCVRRTVPVVGQGEVMEYRDAHLLTGPHSNCLCLYSRNEAEEVSHRILCRIVSLFSLISKEARLAGLLHSLIPSAFLTFWSMVQMSSFKKKSSRSGKKSALGCMNY